MQTRILIPCLLLPALTMAVSAPRELMLDSGATDLPFSFESRWQIEAYSAPDLDERKAPLRGLIIADLDGDGSNEKLTANMGAVQAASIQQNGVGLDLWWAVLPTDYDQGWPSAYLLGTADADRDGIQEVLAVGTTGPDRPRRLWVVRGDDGAALLETPLQNLPERYADGVWDGFYELVGAMDVPTPQGPQPSYVLLVSAGRDLQPRGVLAVDARTGEHLWFHRTSGKPTAAGAVVVDLEDDGRSEVILSTNAVGNYPEEQSLDGRRDDAVRVLVLETDGSLRWRYEFPAQPGGSVLAVEDLEGDGRLEILCATTWPGNERNQVVTFAPEDGAVLGVLMQASPITRLDVRPPLGDRPAHLYLATLTKGLLDYERVGGSWRLARSLQADGLISLREVKDCLPPEGEELLLGLSPSQLVLVDREFRTLAISEPRLAPVAGGMIGRAVDHGLFVLTHPSIRGPAMHFAIVANPSTHDPRLLGLAAVPLLALGIMAERRRRRRQAASVVPGTRDARLQLLGQLELADHGAIGLLKTLRRVVWLGRAARGSGAPAPRERLLELGRESLHRALPRVERMLRLAGAADLEARTVMRPKESLALAQRELADLQDAGYDAPALDVHLPDLESAAQDLENDLQRLRREVAAFFRADLGDVADRVLGLLDEEVRQAGVRVSVQGPRPVWLRIDEEELAFVLDDLVQNALRAMASAGGVLTLAWREDDGAVILDVTDTGVGIVPDDWERIFDPGHSTRPGGGLGLARSRELLRKYEGFLRVLASEPDHGTTLRLRLVQARDIS